MLELNQVDGCDVKNGRRRSGRAEFDWMVKDGGGKREKPSQLEQA
jgi:hypothetical protein